jgi:BASS family bile acid:Na+ symporter
MIGMIKLLRNREFLLLLSIGLGLAWGGGARWTRELVIPALAGVMTLAVMGVPGSVFSSPRVLVWPALIGLVMNYGVLGAVLFGFKALLIHEEALKAGFIIVIAVPPAVAVIPFTMLLRGDSPFSLVATIGCYLGALVLMPLIAVGFLGSEFVDQSKLIWIMIELILIPLVLSRFLLWTGLSQKIEPYKGTLTNWGFFLVTYTIVGLNQAIFFKQPLIIVPVALVALASSFGLGLAIEKIGRIFKVDPKKIISLVLLGTNKNTGLAAGLALALFGDRTALPATVSTIFMIVYIVWLGFKQRKSS